MRPTVFWIRSGFLSTLLLCLTACTSSTRPEVRPPTNNPVLLLQGEVRVDRSSISAGETATIRYLIVNRGAAPIDVVLVDGSSDPKTPIQEFRYNTAHVDNPELHLETLAQPNPLTGPMRFEVGQEVEFARVLVRGSRGGSYRLTGEIQWTGRNYVDFRPSKLQVLGNVDSADTALVEQVRQLVDRLGSADLHERKKASDRLVAIGEPAVPLLLHHMNHEKESVRSYTMTTLDAIGESAEPYLRRMIYRRGADPVVLRRCLFLYAKLARDRAARDLLFALGHERRDVRIVALQAATRFLTSKGCFPLILRGLADRDEIIRRTAHEAVQELTGEDFGYDPLGPRPTREVVIARIRDWWDARQGSK